MDKNVQAYFSALPRTRIAHVTALHQLVVTLFPNVIVDMTYKIPTYRFQEGWVAIANQKYYVSLYTCAAAHIASFKKKHPSYKTGTGCINFTERNPIPLEDLKDVIKHAILHPKDV